MLRFKSFVDAFYSGSEYVSYVLKTLVLGYNFQQFEKLRLRILHTRHYKMFEPNNDEERKYLNDSK